jgi:DNA-binding transcriptional MerR regulator
METYRKGQVIEALNPIIEINEPNLAYYLKLGIITPDVANPSGRAEIKYYGPANLVDIAVVKTLENNGLSLKAIAKVMGSVRDGIRHSFKKFNKNYSVQLIVSDPNTEKSKAKIRACLKKEFQKAKNPIDEKKIELDMDQASSYMVIDLSELISRMKPIL